jgi:hypothetical protein
MALNQKLTHVLAARVVEKVRQEGVVLYLDFADGSSLMIRLEDQASSVMLRDAKGDLQYAD